jgi:hypothetical protein
VKISDHQPFLFGHEGYWSKIAVSDVHVVMADVRYRKEDKLTRATLSTGMSFSAVLVSEDEGTQITSMVLDDARKLRTSIEQTLMTKKHMYRDRLEPMMYLLENGTSYMAIWHSMMKIMMSHCAIKTRILTSSEAPTGESTFERNIDRLGSCVNLDRMDEYVCGPKMEAYKQGCDPCPTQLLIHEMPAPSPLSLIERVVTSMAPLIYLPELRVAYS